MDELALYHSWLQPRLRSWCSQLALNRAHIAEAVEARMPFVSLRYQQKTEAPEQAAKMNKCDIKRGWTA